MLTHGSLFAGIGGFDLGFERTGIETLWTVEIDKNCNRVLEAHWPNLKRYGDVKDVGKHNLAPVDIISGGFPCQDLSVAGRRAGLAGGRSGLWYEFARVIEEMEPEWVVVENVPGLFSSNGGEDFAVIVGTLEQFGYCVAWRVLDSQYFGVPQRRRRVFVIGSLGNGSAVKVLFESEGGEGHTAEGEEAGKRLATDVAASIRSGGTGYRGWIGDAEQGLVCPEKAACLYSAYGTKWNGNRAAESGELFVFQQNQRDEVREMDVAGAIAAEPGVHQQNYICHENLSGSVTPSEQAAALRRGASHSYQFVAEDKFPTLRGFGHGWQGQHNDDLAKVDPQVWEMSHADEAVRDGGETCPTLQQRMGTGGNQVPLVGVRRLTPTECERLQGFPDGWTEGLSDSARYRCLGNAVTVNVAEWIGSRIVETENREVGK